MPVTDLWRNAVGSERPNKIVCVGLNYRDHADEGNVELPTEPLLFGKFSNCASGAGDPIVLPPASTHVDAEAELALVISRTARSVPADDALDVLLGYTCANDVSARNLQFGDGQWFRGKNFDGFCPLGPEIVPVSELGDASSVRVRQRLNGELLQDGTTRDLIFDVRTLIAFVSKVLTLERGDVICTGTPSGVGFYREPKVALAPGDQVEIEIEGVGVLANPVADDG